VATRVALFRKTLPTSGTTVDITTTKLKGLTPKFMLCFANNATADTGTTSHVCHTVGMTDGTTEACFSTYTQTSAGVSNSVRQSANDAVYRLHKHDATTPPLIDAVGSFNSWISEGVRLNLDDHPDGSSIILNCLFFAGDELDVSVDTFDIAAGASSTVTVGFEPELLIGLCNQDDGAASGGAGPLWGKTDTGDAGWGIGFCHVDGDGAGSHRNRSGFHWENDNVTTMQQTVAQSNAQLLTRVVANNAYGNTIDADTFTSTGYDLTHDNTNADGAGDFGGVVAAFNFGGGTQGIFVGMVQTPTVTGSYTDTNPGFLPQAYLSFLSDLSSGGVSKAAGAISNAHGIAAADHSTIQGLCSYRQRDNIATSEAQAARRAGVVYTRLNGGATAEEGVLTAFTSTGWTTNYTTVKASIRRYPLLLIGAPIFLDTETGNVDLDSTVSRSTERDVTGTVDLSGAVTKLTSRLVSGVMDTSSAAVRLLLRTVSGTVDTTSTLSRLVLRTVAGTVDLTSTLGRAMGRLLSGTLDVSGSVAKETRRTMAASLSLVGTSTMSALMTVAGVMGTASSVSRSTLRTVAGGVDLTGSVSRLTSRTVAGVVDLSSSVVKLLKRAVSGVVNLTSSAVSELVVVVGDAIELLIDGTYRFWLTRDTAFRQQLISSAAYRFRTTRTAAYRFVRSAVKAVRFWRTRDGGFRF
jgi:hypothetical protein